MRGRDDLDRMDRIEVEAVHPSRSGACKNSLWRQQLLARHQLLPRIFFHPFPAVKLTSETSPGATSQRTERQPRRPRLAQGKGPSPQLTRDTGRSGHPESVVSARSFANPASKDAVRLERWAASAMTSSGRWPVNVRSRSQRLDASRGRN